MAVAFDSSGTSHLGSTAGATTGTVDITSATAGAFCVVMFFLRGSLTSISAFSGWTSLGVRTTQTGVYSFEVWYRVKVSGDTTFSFTSSSSQVGVVPWVSYTGQDATTPFTVSGTPNPYTTGVYATQSATPSVANSLGVGFFNGMGGSTVTTASWAAPTGMTLRVQDLEDPTSGNVPTGCICDTNGTVSLSAQSYVASATINGAGANDGAGFLLFINPTASTNVTITGVITTAAIAAPAGVYAIAPVINGAVAAVSCAAPNGVVSTTGIVLSGTTATFSSFGASTVQLICPGGLSSTDIMLAEISQATNGTGSGITSVPTGWNAIDSPQSPGGGSAFGFYWKFVGTDTPGSTAYNWGLSTSTRATGVLQAFKGVDTGSPIDGVSGADHAGFNAGGGSTSPSFPSVTSQTAGACFVGAIGARNGTTGLTNNAFTPPAGWTLVPGSDIESASTGANNNAESAMMYQTLTGTPANLTGTLVNSSAYGTFVVALRPVQPASNATIVGVVATASWSATGGTIALSELGPVANASWQALAGGVSTTVVGVVSAIHSGAIVGTITSIVTGSVSSATVTAPAGTVLAQVNKTITGVVSAASWTSLVGGVSTTTNGVVASANWSATAGTPAININGVVTSANWTALAGGIATTTNGVVAHANWAAPAGTLLVATPGPATAVTWSANAGNISTTTNGIIASTNWATPVGHVDIGPAVVGNTVTINVSAPNGNVSGTVNILGAVANLVASSSPGSISSVIAGLRAASTCSALAGGVSTTSSGQSTTILVTAPAGSKPLSLSGTIASLQTEALAGSLSIGINIVGPVSTLTSTATGGVISTSTNGVVSRITSAATAGTISFGFAVPGVVAIITTRSFPGFAGIITNVNGVVSNTNAVAQSGSLVIDHSIVGTTATGVWSAIPGGFPVNVLGTTSNIAMFAPSAGLPVAITGPTAHINLNAFSGHLFVNSFITGSTINWTWSSHAAVVAQQNRNITGPTSTIHSNASAGSLKFSFAVIGTTAHTAVSSTSGSVHGNASVVLPTAIINTQATGGRVDHNARILGLTIPITVFAPNGIVSISRVTVGPSINITIAAFANKVHGTANIAGTTATIFVGAYSGKVVTPSFYISASGATSTNGSAFIRSLTRSQNHMLDVVPARIIMDTADRAMAVPARRISSNDGDI